MRSAKSPVPEDGKFINTILWEDLTKFVDGFKTLNERLGFNVFKKDSPIALFDDTNLPIFASKDIKGESHNFAEAVQTFYKGLKLPISFASAGWDRGDKYIQNAAEELVTFLQKTPEASSEFAVSVNPFHGRLIASQQALKAEKPDLARSLREAYIDTIANAINTFLPLFKNGNPVNFGPKIGGLTLIM